MKSATRLIVASRFELPLLGSNQDSPDPESGVLPITPRGTNGAEGARTPDLLGAIQALSQLSYSPSRDSKVNSPPARRQPVTFLVSRCRGKPLSLLAPSDVRLSHAARRHHPRQLRRRPGRARLPTTHRPRPLPRLAPGLQQRRAGWPGAKRLAAQRALRHAPHDVRDRGLLRPLHLRLGGARRPPGMQDLLPARLRRQPHRRHHPGRVGTALPRRPGPRHPAPPPLPRPTPRPHHPEPAPRALRVMRPVATSFSGVVPAPIEKVFTVLTDPARIQHWLPGCRTVKPHGPGTLAKGSRLSVWFGKRATTLEIIELSPPTAFSWADRAKRAGSQTQFKLQFAGGTTIITMRDVWTPMSLGHLLRGRFLGRRNSRRTFEAVLDNLRYLALR